MRLFKNYDDSPDIWDAAVVYPFDINQKIPKTDSKISLWSFIVKQVNSASKHNSLYQKFVSIKKFFDKNFWGYNATTSLAQTKIIDELVVLHQSGVLSFLTVDIDLEPVFEALEKFSTYLVTEGVKHRLIFVPPIKSGALSEAYMGVYRDDFRLVDKKISQGAIRAGWECLSVLGRVEAMGLTERDLFFKTDHHWLPQSGLLGCALLSEYLKDKGFEIDEGIFDIENYDITYAKNLWFGSQAKKITASYAAPETFPIVTPKYETDLTVFNSEIKSTKSGKIQEILFDYSVFDREIYYHNFYSYGDQPLLQIHNNKRHDGQRILLIKESQANAMIPFMCNMAEYIDAIDLRHFKGSLKTFINKHKPDCVILIYGINGFSEYKSQTENSLTDPFYFE